MKASAQYGSGDMKMPAVTAITGKSLKSCPQSSDIYAQEQFLDGVQEMDAML
jgi:hypothetical protein